MSQFVRHFFSSVLLAGIAVGLFWCAPFTGSDRAVESLLFEARFAAPTEGEAGLFCDRGSGFSRQEAVAIRVAAGPEAVGRFLIPAGTYRAFRLAAPGLPAGFAGARIVDLDGRVLARFGLEQARGEGGMVEIVCSSPLVLRSALAAGPAQGMVIFGAVLLGSLLVLGRFGPQLAGGWERAGAALVRGAAAARRRPGLTLFLSATLAVLVSCHPVVFCGKSFVTPNNGAACLYGRFPTLPGLVAEKPENPKMSDVGAMLWAHLPYSVAEHRALFRDGELPLRLREDSCGVPMLGQGQSMLGDPLHWIALAAGGASWAWDVKFVLAKILFAFGTGLLVRAAVGRLGVAVALAVSSAFIGFFAYRFMHAAFFSLCYAPWILLAWVEIARAPAWRGAVRWVALLMAANWIELNSGTAKESSMLIVGLNFAGLLVLVLAPGSVAGRARKLAAAGAGLGIFLLLSAPCWLVFLDALAHAWTAYNVPHAYQIQPALLLGFFDDLFYRQTMPRENHTNPSANFLLLTGVLWMLVHVRRLAGHRCWLALALAALPFLALTFGVIPPTLLVRLPFIGKITHVDNTFSCVLLVLLFPLAGFGLQVCRDRMTAPEWRGDWVLTLLLLGVLGAAFFGYIQVETKAADALIRESGPVPKSAFFIRYASALFLAAALLPWLARRLLQRPAFAPATLLLALLAFGAMHFRHGMYVATKFDDYVMNPRERADYSARSPAVEYLKARGAEPGRVAGFGDVLLPGYNTVPGLEAIAGADALVSPYYREYLDATRLPMIWDWRLYFSKESTAAQLPFYDLLNLRHYLAMPGTAPAVVPGLKRVGTSDLDLYESPSAWPRAFFTDTLVYYKTADDFAQMVWSGDRRPFAAMQENGGPASGLPSALAARQVVPATSYRLTGNTTTFTIDAPARGLVVLTEAYEAGNFRVTVNGVAAPYGRVNHAFCAVPIPQAGHFTVRFEYWPRRLTLALWMAAAGLLLLAAGAAWLRLSRPAPTA